MRPYVPMIACMLLTALAPVSVTAAGRQSATAAPGAAAAPNEAAPRLPDGHVNLGSSADHKGYWEIRPGLGGAPRPAEVPLQPWARSLYQYRTAKADLYPPLVQCKPGAGPSFFNAPGFEIVDVPELKSIFILNVAGPHSWRIIYMDGRAHPAADALRPTFLGHSVGHWEGDTLVIDSVGFNEKQWVAGAFPTTDKLHMIERIARQDLKTLSYEYTIDDPGAYTAPWSGKWTITEKTASSWVADGELFEYICQDSR